MSAMEWEADEKVRTKREGKVSRKKEEKVSRIKGRNGKQKKR